MRRGGHIPDKTCDSPSRCGRQGRLRAAEVAYVHIHSVGPQPVAPHRLLRGPLMAHMFSNPSTEVLFRITRDRPVSIVGVVDLWGGRHLGLGRVTRDDLIDGHTGLLAELGVDIGEFPEGAHWWILCEDCNGFVTALRFDDDAAYREAMQDYAARWDRFCDSL